MTVPTVTDGTDVTLEVAAHPSASLDGADYYLLRAKAHGRRSPSRIDFCSQAQA